MNSFLLCVIQSFAEFKAKIRAKFSLEFKKNSLRILKIQLEVKNFN
ncbi:hypothetical protein [Campylobacter troglodytis]|nr:hypothetical protein [Campylobacter troglodytis]